MFETMRRLLAEEFTTTTSSYYDEENYYRDANHQEQNSPSYVLIVGLTMAFVGATILIVVICCVCRKRQPPDSQGAMYERAATTDGQSTVTSYPLGPVQTGNTMTTQSGTTNTKTTSAAASSQMSGGHGGGGPPMMHGHPQMYGGHPGHQPYLPGYPPNAANMGPPFIYPVPQPNPNQPMTTLAVFGAPDGAPSENSQPHNHGNTSTTPLPYGMYSTGPSDIKPGPHEPTRQAMQYHMMHQEMQRQANSASQEYAANQQQSSEYPWNQPSAPPPM